MPRVAPPSTAGRKVDLASLPPGRTVIYCYPMTAPGRPLPDGWDAIPGARGLPPEACAFRDHHRELADLAPPSSAYTQSTATSARWLCACTSVRGPERRRPAPRHRAAAADVRGRRHAADQAADVVARAGTIEHASTPCSRRRARAEVARLERAPG